MDSTHNPTGISVLKTVVVGIHLERSIVDGLKD